jgi:uncharacterized protein HemX
VDNSSNTNTKLLVTLLGIVIATIAGAGPYFLQTQAAIDKNLAVMVALQQKSEKDFEKLEGRLTNVENAIPSLISQGDK